MKIIYLHGFNSDENSNTVISLKKIFNDLTGISYDYIIPDLAHEKIKNTIDAVLKIDKEIILVGTSLGAFWANYFAQKYLLKCVLVNPSLYPWVSLTRCIGVNKNFNTGVDRILTESDVTAYKKYEMPIIDGIIRIVVLGINDDVINYKITQEVFQNNSKIILINAGHRIENVENIAKIIMEVSDAHL